MNGKIPLPHRRLLLEVAAGNYVGTKALLDAGVSATCLCSAAINAACLHGRKDLVNLLLYRGADPYDCYSPLCMTEPWWGPAIYWAARRDARTCRYEMLPLLLERHPEPSVHAVQSALNALAEHGRDAGFVNSVGRPLVDAAVKHHGAHVVLNGVHWSWMDYLVQHHRANPHVKGEYNYNALERAVDWSDVRGVATLLANGADPNTVPLDHVYLLDPDNAQCPSEAWAILRLFAMNPGSKWKFPPQKKSRRRRSRQRIGSPATV